MPIVEEPAPAAFEVGPRVGEQEQPSAVRRRRGFFNDEGLSSTGHHEALGGEQYRAPSVARVVEDQFASAAALRPLFQRDEPRTVREPRQGTHRTGRELSSLVDRAETCLDFGQRVGALTEA